MNGAARTVGVISVAPIKSLGLAHPSSVRLSADRVVGDRELFLIDDDDKLYVALRHGPLLRIRPRLDGERLSLTFPDGTEVAGEMALGAAAACDFYGFRTVRCREVEGPWATALSAYAGRRVRLVRADRGDGYDLTPVSIVSSASVARLGEELGTAVDHRRFRMLLTIDGCDAHEEDAWGRVRIGEAVVRVGSDMGAEVPRCGVISLGPDTGVKDLGALRAIRRYRGKLPSGVPFGVYARIERPGRIGVGDVVELL